MTRATKMTVPHAVEPVHVGAQYSLRSDDIELARIGGPLTDSRLLAAARTLANESYRGRIRIERGQLYTAVVFEACDDHESCVLQVVRVRP